jgi:hypothetical protein
MRGVFIKPNIILIIDQDLTTKARVLGAPRKTFTFPKKVFAVAVHPLIGRRSMTAKV